MLEGVEVDVEDDVATVTFVDPLTRGVGIGKLLAAGGPGLVTRVSRPRVAYKVPVAVADAAGLLGDHPAPTEAPQGYDDGLPDMDWSRAAIDAYAAAHGVTVTAEMRNKQSVLDAIAAAAEPAIIGTVEVPDSAVVDDAELVTPEDTLAADPPTE